MDAAEDDSLASGREEAWGGDSSSAYSDPRFADVPSSAPPLVEPVARTPCKYGNTCTRGDCFYAHGFAVPRPPRRCVMGAKCCVDGCPFPHPPRRAIPRKGLLFGMGRGGRAGVLVRGKTLIRKGPGVKVGKARVAKVAKLKKKKLNDDLGLYFGRSPSEEGGGGATDASWAGPGLPVVPEGEEEEEEEAEAGSVAPPWAPVWAGAAAAPAWPGVSPAWYTTPAPPSAAPMCKFGIGCARVDCLCVGTTVGWGGVDGAPVLLTHPTHPPTPSFAHPEGRAIGAPDPPEQCKWGASCNLLGCLFAHAWGVPKARTARKGRRA